jgi:RNA polymerase sigma factor for flagellar operon FliA
MLNAAPTPALSRDLLVSIGLPIVRRIAFRMARRLPPSVEVGDLIGAGTEGLLRAIDGYDPSRCDRFEPYAEARIRGAILDELRGLDVMTRHGRRRMTEVTKAIQELSRALGRAPEEQEIADKLALPLAEYQRIAAELSRAPALGRLGEVDPDEVQSESMDPAALYGEQELRAQLVKSIDQLPERMRQVLALYYQHECTQAEIGQILGVTESRVCQILGEAAARLRAMLVDGAPAKAAKRPAPSAESQRRIA